MIDDDLLQKLHHVLLEVFREDTTAKALPTLDLQIHVEEGAMECQNCKHVYPIMNGIPNMVSLVVNIHEAPNHHNLQLLAEHEIG